MICHTWLIPMGGLPFSEKKQEKCIGRVGEVEQGEERGGKLIGV